MRDTPSMHSTKHYGTAVLLCLAMALSACAAPNTARPTYSKQEVAQEAAEQAKASKLVPAGFDADKTYNAAELAPLRERLNAVAQRVAPAAGALCKDAFSGQRNCQFGIKFAPTEKGINAHADGNDVVVYPGLIDFARNDNHLAFVIAHEFAHNILAHIASQQQNVTGGTLLGTLLDIGAATQGYDTGGTFGKIGGQAGLLRYSQGFEEEADYVGLYILARAGYKIEDAPDFWRAMSAANPESIYGSRVSTHPSNATRYIAMNKAIAEINAKKAAGQPLIPNFQQSR